MTLYPSGIDTEMSKKCSKCKILKNISDFGKSSKSKTGLKSACKVYLRSQGREYAKRKRLAMSEGDRQNHAQKCKDWRNKKLQKNPDFWKEEYRKNHKRNLKNASKHYWNYREQKIKEMKIWRKNNSEKHRQSVKNWRENNYEKMLASHRRCLKENAAHVREYNRYQCAYCGGEFEHVDHVKSLSKSGPHCLSNLRPACKKCNLSKHNKNLYDWLKKEFK